MFDFTIRQLGQALRRREFSVSELTQTLLQRIEQFNPTLNAFITPTPEQARQQAATAEARLAAGTAEPLTGIPLAHKDLFCTAGVRTTCGSRMLADFIAPYDAAVTERCQAAGMVMLGKTNMDEFAMGSSNENSFFGPVRNPWDRERVPGGSSGGSAAAVAARLVPAATGTDTGGSIRQPAAFTGITGLKPTYGRVSRWGMVAFASSLDQGGIMARTSEDCALILQAIAGFDPRDSTSADREVPNYSATLDQDLSGLTIGLPKEYFSTGLDSDIEQRIQEAIGEYRKLGAEVREISLPSSALAIPAYYVIAPAEASSNLARYDGVRYGYRCEHPRDLLDLYTRSRGEGFGAEVKRRIMVGTYALSAGYFDAYYRKAQQIRRLIREDFQNAFREVDLILGPTTPTTAFALGTQTDDPVTMYLNDIYTVAVNLAGLPALSHPVGFVANRPVGLQLIANYFNEARLLNSAHRYQQVSNWHQQLPPGCAD